MFVVLIEYIAPLETIDSLMNQHVAFLEPHFKTGTFIAAGRRKPRSGGIILARGKSKAAIAAIMDADPFVTKGAARYELVEFRTSLHSESFAAFADPRTRTIR